MNNSVPNENLNEGASSSIKSNKIVEVKQNYLQAEESFWSELDNASILEELLNEPFDFEDSLTTSISSKLRQDENYKGFDNNSGRHWIYPINFPIRQYQFNIAKVSLFNNTLVVLPTGLGKTFIAAVVMYNIFRWYPMGKIIFMAPTRPLVSQQIEACRRIMGISLSDTAEMTGKQNKKKRVDLWQTKRIFFATPQVIQSDICDVEQNFPFDAIKLIVIDEAHKAKGRYAYVEVVKSIHARNRNIRIMALTATPGRRLEDVGEVIQNLFISKIEVRWENCIDVAPYTHKKNIKVVNVPLGEELTEIREELINIIDPYIRNLMDHGFLQTSHGNSDNLSKGWILMEQKRFREISMHHRHPNHSKIATDFSICVSLYHSLELLERHGLRVFINFFDNPDPENKNEKFFVKTNFRLNQFLNKVRGSLGPSPFEVTNQTMTNGQIPCIPNNIDFGHPKFEMVKKLLIEHFQDNKDSRIIVFCEFRESVMLMHKLLLQSRPLIKPQIFVGQGNGTNTTRAVVTQKQQLKIMNDFRQNVCNALIATCVAEEGLDIGEVDLIICFDISTKNPTRLVQRIGRTGRKRDGKIIMMVTEGKEQNIVKETLANRDKINQKLSKSREIINCLYKYSPRLVPPQFNPICLEIYMQEQSQNIEHESVKEKCSRKKKAEKKPEKKRKVVLTNNKNSDVRKFFRKIDLDPDEQEIYCTPMTTQQKEFQINKIKDDIICLDNCDGYQFFENIEQTRTSALKNTNVLIHNECTTSKSKLPTKKTLKEQNSPSTLSIKSSESFNHLKSSCSTSTSTSSLPCSNDTDLKIKLRKLNRLTRNINKAKNSNFHDYTNIIETLKSKIIDKRIKKYILAHNIEFVQMNFERMKRLWGLIEKERVIEVADKSEKQTRLIYTLIESVLGEKENIENFIKNFNKNSEHILRKFINYNYKFQKNNTSCAKDNIDEWIDAKLQNYKMNDFDSIGNPKEDETFNNQSIIDSEDGLEMSADFVTESRYAYQYNEELSIKAQSTPLLMKNSKSIKNLTKQFFNSSPIAAKQDNKIETLYQNKEKLKIIHEEQDKPLYLDNKNNSIYKRLEFDKMNAGTKIIHNRAESKNEFPTIEMNTQKKFEWLENQANINITGSNASKEYQHFLQFENQSIAEFSVSDFNMPSNKLELLQSKSEPSCTKIIKKNVEISVDLFDDDFDEFVASSENMLQSIEYKSKLQDIQHKTSQNKSIAKSIGILEKHFPKVLKGKDNNLDTEIKEIMETNSKHLSPSSSSNISILVEEKSMKFDDYFNDSDFDFLSQSIEKLNSNLRYSKIFDKSLDMVPVTDILQIVQETDNKRNLNQKQSECEGNCSLKLNSFKKSVNAMSNSQKENSTPSKLNNEKNNNHKVSDFFKSFPTNISSISANNNLKTPSSHKIESNDDEVSPSLIGKRKLNLFNLKKTTNEQISKILRNEADDTIMPPRKGYKRLKDTDSEDESIINKEDIWNSQIVEASPRKEICRKEKQYERRRKRRKHCPFISDEAVHSGDDTDDGANQPSEFNSMFVDSIVISDNEEVDDSSVNMHAKYLQSIRSPTRPLNGFKIPSPRVYMDLSKIYSQPVVQESFAAYKEDSFVVSDEENVFDNEINELDELDKAEAILKAKRKARRLEKESKKIYPKNRRRILSNIFEISDDDD